MSTSAGSARRFLERGGAVGAEDRTVTLSVASRDAVRARVDAAFRGERQGAFITFASVDLLWQTLTRERWDLLQAVTGQPVLSTVDLAERLGRDPRTVRLDVEALSSAGVLDLEDDRVSFPFEALHVDFTLRKAA